MILAVSHFLSVQRINLSRFKNQPKSGMIFIGQWKWKSQSFGMNLNFMPERIERISENVMNFWAEKQWQAGAT